MQRLLLVLAAVVLSLPAAAFAAPEGQPYDYKTDASLVWEKSITGQGQTIAVIDDGVVVTHPWFRGQVVAEACFSIPPVGSGWLPTCPGATPGELVAGPLFGPGTALPATSGHGFSEATWAKLAPTHGTAVAGAAAGARVYANGTLGYRGMAPDANLIAINSSTVAPDGDGSSLASDEALVWLDQHRVELDLSVVNFSAAADDGPTDANCDKMKLHPVLLRERAAIDALVSHGVEVVVAAGNVERSGDPRRTTLGFPGCLSDVISVGATDPAVGNVARFSHTSSVTTVFAPGKQIFAPSPSSVDEIPRSGTSMAAPLVAGAIALYKETHPDASPADVQHALTTTGRLIQIRPGIWKRSLNVAELVDLNEPTDLGGTHAGCLHLSLRTVRNKPRLRQGFVKLSCKPSDNQPAALVLEANGPGTIKLEKAVTDVPIADKKYYTDNTVEYGTGAFEAPAGRYRVCWHLYSSEDLEWPSLSRCKDFTV